MFLQGQYEVQVLDSYDNKTYPDGQCGALYGRAVPLVNACRKPGEWQSYDIIYHRPLFDKDGKVTRKATFTIFQNGVLIQDHVELTGGTGWINAHTDHRLQGPRRQGPDPAPGPRQPGPLPQRLGPRAEGLIKVLTQCQYGRGDPSQDHPGRL